MVDGVRERDVDVVLDRSAHEVRGLLRPVRIHVGGRNGDEVRAIEGEQAGDFGVLDIRADTDADFQRSPIGAQRHHHHGVTVAGCERVVLAVEEMGLAVHADQAAVAADDEGGVVRPVGLVRVPLEEADHDRNARPAGEIANRGRKRALDVLGEGEHRRIERVPLDEALREDDEIGTRPRRAADVASGEGKVGGRLADARAHLGDSDPQPVDRRRRLRLTAPAQALIRARARPPRGARTTTSDRRPSRGASSGSTSSLRRSRPAGRGSGRPGRRAAAGPCRARRP